MRSTCRSPIHLLHVPIIIVRASSRIIRAASRVVHAASRVLRANHCDALYMLTMLSRCTHTNMLYVQVTPTRCTCRSVTVSIMLVTFTRRTCRSRLLVIWTSLSWNGALYFELLFVQSSYYKCRSCSIVVVPTTSNCVVLISPNCILFVIFYCCSCLWLWTIIHVLPITLNYHTGHADHF